MQGLRTLVLATKIIKEQEYQEWNGHYSLAASSLEDREARIAAEAEKIERGLELVGVTAIEDKLQEGVPQAINSLITANIKVPEPWPHLRARAVQVLYYARRPCWNRPLSDVAWVTKWGQTFGMNEAQSCLLSSSVLRYAVAANLYNTSPGEGMPGFSTWRTGTSDHD